MTWPNRQVVASEAGRARALASFGMRTRYRAKHIMFMRLPGEYVTKSLDLGVRTSPPYDGHYNRSSGCALSANTSWPDCQFSRVWSVRPSRGRPLSTVYVIHWAFAISRKRKNLLASASASRASPTIRKSDDRRRRPGSVSGFCT